MIYQLFGFVLVGKEKTVLLEVPPKCCLHGGGAEEAGQLDMPPPGLFVNGVSHSDTWLTCSFSTWEGSIPLGDNVVWTDLSLSAQQWACYPPAEQLNLWNAVSGQKNWGGGRFCCHQWFFRAMGLPKSQQLEGVSKCFSFLAFSQMCGPHPGVLSRTIKEGILPEALWPGSALGSGHPTRGQGRWQSS